MVGKVVVLLVAHLDDLCMDQWLFVDMEVDILDVAGG